MAAPQNFRNAFNGFNKEDVVQYLEYINTKHNNQVNQLTTEMEELRTKLDQPNEELLAVIESLKEQCAELTAKLDASEAARIALEEQLECKAEEAPAAEEPAVCSELETYRRAERTEREARERAELVYFQANGVLTETCAKVDSISAEITQMADQVMSQLTQLQMLVSGSKHALQDASSMLSTIRPNK